MKKKLPKEIEKEVNQWLAPPFDATTQEEVKYLIDHDPKALFDAFYTKIAFGTGGLRGIMGVGTNRLNRYTIRACTQGLANYLLKQHPNAHCSLFISYDSRHHSRFFAEETARVLAANGMKVYLTHNLRPTPFVSFGLRYFKCSAGVMITASHNPPEFNGYKVYWEDGAQVVSPHALGIIEEVKKIKDQNRIPLIDLPHPLVKEVADQVDAAYIETLFKLQNHPHDNQLLGYQVKILYSSLHGAGKTLIPKALNRWGFTSLSFVEEEMSLDGSFPSLPSPNPEQKEALQRGIDQLIKNKNDLFIATDPDADRLGLVVYHEEKPHVLNGNQIASLMLFYLLKTLTSQKKLPPNGAVVTTIVTTDLLGLIAYHFNITCVYVLTGFKYIGEKIHLWEKDLAKKNFIFGAEESLGFLYGTHSRDKDAIITGCLIAEMALQQKKEKKTLVDLLRNIYQIFGIFREKQLNISFKSGKDGKEKMSSLMAQLRNPIPTHIGTLKVIVVEDYQNKIKRNFISNHEEKLSLPTSNVLILILEDQSKFIIRPSGTEPKIKIYGMISVPFKDPIEETFKQCDALLDKRLQIIKNTHFT